MKWMLMGLALISGAASAQQTGEVVRIDQAVEQDLYLAGRLVEVTAPVTGDITAGAMEVVVSAPLSGDLIAAGDTVRIEATVGDDVRAAGRRVDIAADVADHVVAAGEQVTLSQGRRIGGFAWLAGARVRLDGDIGGELRVMAEQVVINGTVGGDADITANRIVLGPNARINGDLFWRSEQRPESRPGASVEGRTIARPMPPVEPPGLAAAIFGALFFLLVLITTGLVLYLLFPRFGEQQAAAARHRPWAALGLGLAVLAATPLVIVLLFITGIGAMLGLILLALYLIALPVGWLGGALCTSEWLLSRRVGPFGRGRHLLFLILAIVVLSVVQLIPLLGQLTALIVLLFGLGGFTLAGAQRYRTEPVV